MLQSTSLEQLYFCFSRVFIKRRAQGFALIMRKTGFVGDGNVRRIIRRLRLLIGGIVVMALIITSLVGHYYAALYLRKEDSCQRLYGTNIHDGFDAKALSERVSEVLEKMVSLQNKLEDATQGVEKDKDQLDKANISMLAFRMYLEKEIVRPLYDAHIGLREIRLPRIGWIRNTSFKEEPLINSFASEEMRTYITPKENREGRVNVYKTERVFNTIGHACVLLKKELEEYMKYETGGNCKEDWHLAQKLMLHGCDPLPRRRCLSRSPKLYVKPDPINESLWKIPDDRNVRWSNYHCKDFKCLSSKNPHRGYSKCSGCFEMEKEKLKWVTKSSLPVDFLTSDVLAIKPGEIRIGLDYSVDTGTFGARMREHNVTVISTALNIGAPFSEVIALCGLLPLYVTPNQRLPFFDNTMDLIHTTGFLDGWIDLLLLDFVLFDWDRILRPGGLLWVDRFFCSKNDLDDYMHMFLKFRYKRHKWAVAPKSKDEVYLSALLEKPQRSV